MSNEKNNEVFGIIGAVALLIALAVPAGTVIYGAFGGYGSFYEMFCASVRNVLITWAISAAIALLFSAIAGIIILFGRLCLNAWKHPRTAITLAILGLLIFWQSYAEVSRSKQVMASDPWAEFVDFDPPSKYVPPPGFEPVDDKDYPPPPRRTTTRGLIGAGVSGINAGIAGTLGLPFDIANTALRGVGLQTAQAPIMGSARLRDLERRVGINPDIAPGATVPEKIAHAAGYGAAAAMLPAAGIGLLGETGTLAVARP